MNNNQSKAAVIGATGYTGLELVRLLRRHPSIDLAGATSESEAGRPVSGTALRYVKASDLDFDAVDIVFSALPPGESADISLRAHGAGVRVVDLSADLRAGRGGAVYGVPELWRDSIREQTLVANPGCYPTGILLGLAPLIRAGMIDDRAPVIIDAASGVTGAGRGAKRDMLFGEVADDYRAYGVGNAHRHVPEIAAGLARIAGEAWAPEFVFTPHLLPVRRGILETMYIPLAAGVTRAAVLAACTDAYRDEVFVDVRAEGLPSLRDVVGTNTVSVGFAEVERVSAPMLLGVVAFDNLLKGAAGQAVQNANLMLGLGEQGGIPL
jgi:N-acetyl-gamma-glutamyl-phosphate reductase